MPGPSPVHEAKEVQVLQSQQNLGDVELHVSLRQALVLLAHQQAVELPTSAVLHTDQILCRVHDMELQTKRVTPS